MQRIQHRPGVPVDDVRELEQELFGVASSPAPRPPPQAAGPADPAVPAVPARLPEPATPTPGVGSAGGAPEAPMAYPPPAAHERLIASTAAATAARVRLERLLAVSHPRPTSNPAPDAAPSVVPVPDAAPSAADLPWAPPPVVDSPWVARTVTGASIEPVRRDPSGRAGRTLDPDLEAAYFAGLPPPEESAAERHRRPPMHQVVPRRRRRWWFGRSAGAR